ncbi:MAG: hypothetical protein ABI625_10745 [bacterium]
MTKSPGIIASAVVCMVGSVLTLLIAAAMVFAVPGQTASVPAMRTVSLVTAVMFVGFGAVGMATGVGILRLRPWARTSILVFAGIMSALSLMTGVMMAFIPLPSTPGVDPSAIASIRPMLTGVYAVPFLIGVWWLFQFNSKSTKAAFASEMTGSVDAGKPLGVSVLGWWFLISGISCVIPAAMRTPAFVAGLIWTGWAATAFYVGFGGLWCYLGAGLLRLDARVRVFTIAALLAVTANALVTSLAPGARDRLVAYQKLVSYGVPPQSMPDMNAMYRWIAVMSVVFTAAVILYLVRRRGAFHDAALLPD